MVTLTNDPEGRTYINYTWKLKEGLTQLQIAYPDPQQDYVQVATPFIVPNGKWVMERPNYGWSWLVGVTHEELEVISYTDQFGGRYALYVSDKPFGYIAASREDVDDLSYESAYEAACRKTLFCARQIHKGELGQTVPIQRLSYVRQAFEPHRKPSIRNPRDRKRGNGWVRLVDLAAATGLKPEHIVFGYWRFSGHRNYWYYHKDQDGGQLLDVVVAVPESEIKGVMPTVLSLTRQEAGRLFSGRIDNYLGAFWVRRGFAYTVLRLQALGVRPEVYLPV